MLYGVRFFVAGYLEYEGYGIKDLEDGIVEYFDELTVLSMAEKVKIYGVENGSIDLRWFDSYYARLALVLGEDNVGKKLGIIRCDGTYMLYKENDNAAFNLDFVEFVEIADVLVDGFPQEFVYPQVCEYMIKHNSRFFHMSDDEKNFGYFDTSLVKSLNINSLLSKDSTVYFDGDSDVIFYDVEMHSCKYYIFCSGDVYLLRNNWGERLSLQLSVSSVLYVSRHFQLSYIIKIRAYQSIRVIVEKGVDIDRLLKLLCNDMSYESYLSTRYGLKCVERIEYDSSRGICYVVK